jgi:hypothetical protein
MKVQMRLEIDRTSSSVDRTSRVSWHVRAISNILCAKKGRGGGAEMETGSYYYSLIPPPPPPPPSSFASRVDDDGISDGARERAECRKEGFRKGWLAVACHHKEPDGRCY